MTSKWLLGLFLFTALALLAACVPPPGDSPNKGIIQPGDTIGSNHDDDDDEDDGDRDGYPEGGYNPAAPTGLAAAPGATFVTLSWIDNSDNEYGFQIERRRGSWGEYRVIAWVGRNTTKFTDTAVTVGVKYTYRVRARNYGGISAWSNTASAAAGEVPAGTVPAAPGSLIASAPTSTQTNLTWTDNSANETGFKLERKTGATGTWAQIATPAASVTVFADSGLTAGTTYYYRVRATNAAGDSAYSNEASVTTSAPPVVTPAAPANIAGTAASSTQINLTWADNSANETGFKLERKTGATGTWAQIAAPAANVTTFVNTGLTASTTYYYRVRATNAAGDSAYSNEASVTTSAPPVVTPAAPANLAGTAASSTQINLTWTDNSANETGFKLERKTGTAGTWAQIAAPAANATTFVNAGLTASTTYYYRVRATNAAGDSAYSNELLIATLPAPVVVPSAPSGLAATVGSSTQVNLAWTDNSNNETGFKLERKTGATGTWAQIAAPGADITTFSNTGLAASTTYFYRVRATNSAGDSAYSNEASVTTSAPAVTIPVAPANLAGVAAGNTVTLTWTDAAGNETGFKLERKTGTAGTWAQIAAPAANATTFVNAGLTASTTYYYRIRATNSAGDSAYSNEAVVTTPAPPADSYLVLAYNDTGMNVMSQTYDTIMFAPPNNTLRAQVIKRGDPPVVVTSGVTLGYSIPGNTSSSSKVNFWTYAPQLLNRTLAANVGITGNGLTGAMTWNSGGFFNATGIPLTPMMDNGTLNAYPLATVTVTTTADAKLVATTQTPAAVSWEIRCTSCHSLSSTLSLHPISLTKPVFCGRCHTQAPLTAIAPGSSGYSNFSRAIHGSHSTRTSNCFSCHPGTTDKYSRDVHFSAGLTCASCHGSMATVGSTSRQPWVDQPACTNCHNVAGHTYEQAGKLYKDSVGHGGVSCAACHGAPHAIGPSSVAADNAQAIALQGVAGKITDCTVCHLTPPAIFSHIY